MAQTIDRLSALKTFFGYSRSTTYNRIADGTLPKPVRMGPRLVGIPHHEIQAVLAARVAGKSDDEIRELVARLEAQRKVAA